MLLFGFLFRRGGLRLCVLRAQKVADLREQLFRRRLRRFGSGRRFLRGLNYTEAGLPVITTNGIGTSRCKLRLFAPSEVVVVELRACAGNKKTKSH